MAGVWGINRQVSPTAPMRGTCSVEWNCVLHAVLKRQVMYEDNKNNITWNIIVASVVEAFQDNRGM